MSAPARSRSWVADGLVLVAVALGVLLLAPGQAVAEPGDAPRSVVLMDVSPASEQGAVRLETLRIHLSDVRARILLERPGERATTAERVKLAVALGRRAGAAAVLFVEELGAAELRVYWVEPKQARVWMRSLSIGSDGADAASEKAALIARGGVEELLEAGRLSIAPVASVPANEPQPPTKAAPPPASVTESRQPTLGVGAAYQGTTFASEAPWQNGAQLSLSARLGPSFYASAMHSFMLPLDVAHRSVAAHLVRRPTEVALGYRANHRLGLRGELGVFADWVERSTTGVGAEQQPTQDQGRLLFGASARMGLDLRVAARARVAGLFGLQALFNHFNYLADDSTGEVAIRVRAVRPTLEAGIVIGFL